MEVIEKRVPTEHERMRWLAAGGQIKVFFATHRSSPDAPAAWGMTAWKDGFLSGNKIRLRKASGVIDNISGWAGVDIWEAATTAIDAAAHLMAESAANGAVANGSPWELCLIPSPASGPYENNTLLAPWNEFLAAQAFMNGTASRLTVKSYRPKVETIEAGIEALRSAGRIIRVERDVDDPRHAEAKLLARAAAFGYAVNQAVKV